MEWCERVIVRATTSVEDDGTGGAITRIEAVRRLLDNGEDGKTGETGKTGKTGETAGETRDKTEGGGGEGGCGSGEGEGEGDDGKVGGGGRLYKHSSSGYEDTGGDSPYSGGSAADAPFAEWDGVRTSSVEKLDKEEEQASRALHHVRLLDSAGVTDGSGAAGGAAGGGGGVKGLMVHIGERVNDRGRPLSAPMRLKLSPATSYVKPAATHRKSVSQNNVQGSTHNSGDPHLLYPKTAASVTTAAPDEELEREYGVLAEQYALVSLHRFFHIHADDMDLYNASGTCEICIYLNGFYKHSQQSQH